MDGFPESKPIWFLFPPRRCSLSHTPAAGQPLPADPVVYPAVANPQTLGTDGPREIARQVEKLGGQNSDVIWAGACSALPPRDACPGGVSWPMAQVVLRSDPSYVHGELKRPKAIGVTSEGNFT